MTQPYDSILTHPALSPLQETVWWTVGAPLPDRDAALQPRVQSLADQPWMVVVTLLVLVVIIAAWCNNRQYLNHRIQTFFVSSRRFNNNADNISSAAGRGFLLCSLMFAACVSFALLLCPHLCHLQVTLPSLIPFSFSNPHHTFLLLFVIGVFIVLLKAAAYSAVNWTFFPHKDNQEWLSAWTLLTGLLSIPLLALVVLQTFTPLPSQNITISALILFILYKIAIYYKLKVNFHIKNYGSLLILLYLCTLEIAPALAVWHFFEIHSTT